MESFGSFSALTVFFACFGNGRLKKRYIEMSGIPKAFELKDMNKSDLTKSLADLKQELCALRVNQVAGATASKLARIHDVRKGIARVMTISHQKQREELRKFYKNKKYIPLDLRPKLTRAMRRALSPKEMNAKTERQRQRAIHFSVRKFALKA